jgi:AraC-like DNA-binding protein
MEVHHEYCSKCIGFELAVKSKLYEFCVTLLRGMPDEEKNHTAVNDGLRFKQIIAFLNRNFDDPDITLESVSKESFLSKYYFSRYFKKHAGESYHTWLSRRRVRRAKEYLREQNKSIIDIAYQCGFSSLATFNRVFKIYAGLTPTDYREGKKDEADGNTEPLNITTSSLNGYGTPGDRRPPAHSRSGW